MSQGGGSDTIKVTDKNFVGFTATVEGFNSDCVFDFSGSNYGSSGIYSYNTGTTIYDDYILYRIKDDGILMTNVYNNFSMKLQGFTDEDALKEILGKTSGRYYALSHKSTVAGQKISGTKYNDDITVNHPNCEVYGDSDKYRYSGNDTLTASTDRNTLIGNDGNDIIIVSGNYNSIGSSYSFDCDGNDTIISTGTKNKIYDEHDSNTFIIGGDKNTVVGGSAADKFTVYSYENSGASVTLTGGGNNDTYIFTTGRVGAEGQNVNKSSYNKSNNDTINVAVTDLDSLDTIKIYNDGTTKLGHDVSAAGITIQDNTGRINIFLPGQHDWDAIKGTKVYYNDQNRNSGTTTLAKLASSTLSPTTVTGATLDGTTLNLDSTFSGNLWVSKNNNWSKVKEINAEETSKNMIIAGNSQSNLILGGSGKNSLWGGKGGNNTLTGGSSRDQYWFSGGGNDAVTNFTAGTSSDADVLVFYNTGFKNITRSGENIIVTGTTGKKITLQSDSGSDTAFLYAKNGKSISVAKVGENSDTSLTYDSSVKYYKLSGNGTLNVTGADSHRISLTGGGVTYSGITNIDASDATGNNILVGSSKSANSIVGGSGKNSLWGGKGNYSDTLIGGDGKDVFWWTKNSGSDEVENASQDDTIKLMSIKVKDLSRKKVYDDSIVLTLKNGNSLIIENSSDVTPTFNFAGGKNYVYNRTTNKWSKT